MKSSVIFLGNNFKKYTQKLCSFGWKVAKLYSFYYVTKEYVIPFDIVICRGASMEPILKNYDIVLTEKSSVTRNRLKK